MRPDRSAHWMGAAVGLLIIGVLGIGIGTGACTEYVGIGGQCVSQPALGWPGAILVAALCLTGAVYSVVRALRRTR